MEISAVIYTHSICFDYINYNIYNYSCMAEQIRAGQIIHPQLFLLILRIFPYSVLILWDLYNFFGSIQHICYVYYSQFLLYDACVPLLLILLFLYLISCIFYLFFRTHLVIYVFFLLSFIYKIATFQHQILICLLEIFHFRSFIIKLCEFVCIYWKWETFIDKLWMNDFLGEF